MSYRTYKNQNVFKETKR